MEACENRLENRKQLKPPPTVGRRFSLEFRSDSRPVHRGLSISETFRGVLWMEDPSDLRVRCMLTRWFHNFPKSTFSIVEMDQVFGRKGQLFFSTQGFDIMYRSPIKVEVLHIQNQERGKHSKACGLYKPKLDRRVKQIRNKSKAHFMHYMYILIYVYITCPQNLRDTLQWDTMYYSVGTKWIWMETGQC